jgi:hypothetical protein
MAQLSSSTQTETNASRVYHAVCIRHHDITTQTLSHHRQLKLSMRQHRDGLRPGRNR